MSEPDMIYYYEKKISQSESVPIPAPIVVPGKQNNTAGEGNSMSIIAVLKNLTVPRLLEHGFQYEGKQGSVRWVFTRKVRDIRQFIIFQKSNYAHALRVQFSTSNKEQPGIDGYKPGIDGYRLGLGIPPFWDYNDDISLEKVIEGLTEIAVNYGLPCLELMSQPDLTPKDGLQKVLCNTAKEKALEFSNRFQLSFNDPINCLMEVEKVLLARKTEVEGVDWDIILLASAYFGELIRTTLGGNWGWNDTFSACMINGIRGLEPPLVSDPLGDVSRFWGKPTMIGYSLVECYRGL